MPFMKKTAIPKSGQPKTGDFAPSPINEDTSRIYFDRGARPIIQRNHANLISLILAVGLAGAAWSFGLLIPLKTVETFQVTKVDGGRLVTDGEPVGRWSPDSDSIAYFINNWGKNVFDINASTIESTIAESSQMTVGTAVEQLRELRRKDNPLALLRESPGLSRQFKHTSINFIKDDVALLRFRTITRAPGIQPKEQAYAMTVTFVRVKPTTRAQVMQNPAGLFISNFNLTEEALSK